MKQRSGMTSKDKLAENIARVSELEAYIEGFVDYVMTYAQPEVFSGALNAAGEAVEKHHRKAAV